MKLRIYLRPIFNSASVITYLAENPDDKITIFHLLNK